MQSCLPFETASLLGKKWTLPLLQQIEQSNGEGFNELMRRLKKVSPKILAQRLKELEHHSIIMKAVEDTTTGRTVYALTKKGKELQQLLLAFRAWNERHDQELAGCSDRECSTCERY